MHQLMYHMLRDYLSKYSKAPPNDKSPSVTNTDNGARAKLLPYILHQKEDSSNRYTNFVHSINVFLINGQLHRVN